MNKHRHYFVAVVTHVQTLLSPGSAGAGVPKLLLGQGTQGNPGGNSECAAQPSHGRREKGVLGLPVTCLPCSSSPEEPQASPALAVACLGPMQSCPPSLSFRGS